MAARRPLRVLSPDDLDRFRERGFVRVPQAFDPSLARALHDVVWDELADSFEIERHDRSTWRTPPKSPQGAKVHPLNERLPDERFLGIIGDLLGHDDWQRPPAWGGFLVTMPEAAGTRWNVPKALWHWDGMHDTRGLVIFSFYSSVATGGGGTLLLEGSHRAVRAHYDACSDEELARPHREHRKAFFGSHPWLVDLVGQGPMPDGDRVAAFMDGEVELGGSTCRIAELTGEPGDAVFCDVRMVHSPAPNCAEVPRVMRSKFLFLEPGERDG